MTLCYFKLPLTLSSGCVGFCGCEGVLWCSASSGGGDSLGVGDLLSMWDPLDVGKPSEGGEIPLGLWGPLGVWDPLGVGGHMVSKQLHYFHLHLGAALLYSIFSKCFVEKYCLMSFPVNELMAS